MFRRLLRLLASILEQNKSQEIRRENPQELQRETSGAAESEDTLPGMPLPWFKRRGAGKGSNIIIKRSKKKKDMGNRRRGIYLSVGNIISLMALLASIYVASIAGVFFVGRAIGELSAKAEHAGQWRNPSVDASSEAEEIGVQLQRIDRLITILECKAAGGTIDRGSLTCALHDGSVDVSIDDRGSIQNDSPNGE